MSVLSDIQAEINYYDGKISEYEGIIAKYDDQMEELDLLKAKYDGLRVKFEDLQDARMFNLANVQASPIQNQILDKYYDEMYGILTGTDFNKACNGLATAKEVIQGKIDEIAGWQEDYEGYLTSAQNSRSYWIEQKRIARQNGEV